MKLTRDQLAWAQATQGGPAMPPAKPPRKRRARKHEASVSIEIRKALRAHPLVAWTTRINRGVAFYGERGERRVPFNYMPGISDRIGQLKDGRFLAVEVKAPGEIPSQEQQDFIDLVNRNGGVAFVARAAEDVIKTLESA